MVTHTDAPGAAHTCLDIRAMLSVFTSLPRNNQISQIWSCCVCKWTPSLSTIPEFCMYVGLDTMSLYLCNMYHISYSCGIDLRWTRTIHKTNKCLRGELKTILYPITLRKVCFPRNKLTWKYFYEVFEDFMHCILIQFNHFAISFHPSSHNNPTLSPHSFIYPPGCLAIHWRVLGLTGAIPRKKTDFPSPRSYQSPAASQPGVEIYVYLPSPCWGLPGLTLHTSCACSHNCCVHLCNCPIAPIKHSFFVITHCLWLLGSFCPLFRNSSKALGGRGVLQMYHSRLRTLQALTLCTLNTCWSLC